MARIPGGEAATAARIAAAPGLNREASHRLAGLLDAECHLAVAPNNRDGWRCLCEINLRDDDRQILQEAQAGLGMGRLAAVRARNGSRPQVTWKIESKVECLALVRLLDEHPLRGRKLKEYEIWREAASVWAARRYGVSPSARLRLQRLATGLKGARAYRAPDPDAPLPALTDGYVRYYFAGFFSGEGCFGLRPRDARFVIKLRRDDKPLLEAFRTELGIGTVCDVGTPEPWSPAAVWHVTGARDVLQGITLLETGGLLGRKRRQFEAWRPGAEAVARAKVERKPADAAVVADARRNLALATAYLRPDGPLPADHAHADARKAYIDVLREWADRHDGPLSCTAFMGARQSNPHWPKRDTIAWAFGGWYEALRSAGLERRAARRPSVR